MGWETGISLGASGISGFANTQNAKAETSAMAESAENTVANQANQTSRTIGTLETSFLKGGIALGGAGTNAFFTQAGQQGQTDISRTITNATASINNTMNASRTQSLNAIGAAFGKISPTAASGAIEDAEDGFKKSPLMQAWNGMTGNTDPSPTGGFGSGINWGGF